MVEAIDHFLDTDLAKKNGVFSRNDFITRVLAMWFSHFEKEFGLFVPREVARNLKGFDTMQPIEY